MIDILIHTIQFIIVATFFYVLGVRRGEQKALIHIQKKDAENIQKINLKHKLVELPVIKPKKVNKHKPKTKKKPHGEKVKTEKKPTPKPMQKQKPVKAKPTKPKKNKE